MRTASEREPWGLLKPLWLVLLVLAALVVGGCSGVPRVVKVPVPVPCIASGSLAPLEQVPIQGMTAAEARALVAAGQYQVLADRIAASLRILAAERAGLHARLKACAELPPAAPKAVDP